MIQKVNTYKNLAGKPEDKTSLRRNGPKWADVSEMDLEGIERDFFNRSQLGAHYFLVYLFQILYMFRATVCPLSGELTASVRHWYFSLCMVGYLVCWF